MMISSSAVAQKPRDASCPSVVSFNSVIPRAQAFVFVISSSDHFPLRTIKCCSAVFGVTLRLLVIHFVVVSRQKQTPSLTSDECHQLAGLSRLSILHLSYCSRSFVTAEGHSNVSKVRCLKILKPLH